MLLVVNRNPTRRDLNVFGFSMALGFGVIGGLIYWRWGTLTAPTVLWCLGAGLCVASFGPMGLARAVYVGWMTGAAAIGKVMLPVFLTIVFVLVLPVFALVRFTDPLRAKLRRDGATYWEKPSVYEPTLERMRRPF
ncbi:MAG: hypothetical protein HOP29_20250 [Phycisphaerales bacterium]|nr:hypothetical protein [Phycisphaerales bacterium]